MKYTIAPDRSKLTITVDEAERQELRESSSIQQDATMYEFFEPLTCNSELAWVYPDETGDLTDAPMLGLMGEWNGWHQKIVERWAFMDYQVRSVLEDLRDNGECVFVGGPLEPAEPKQKMSNDDFSTYLHAIVGRMSAGQILSYGDVYTVLAEELNNEVIEEWERDNEKRKAK